MLGCVACLHPSPFMLSIDYFSVHRGIPPHRTSIGPFKAAGFASPNPEGSLLCLYPTLPFQDAYLVQSRWCAVPRPVAFVPFQFFLFASRFNHGSTSGNRTSVRHEKCTLARMHRTHLASGKLGSLSNNNYNL